MFRYKDVLIMLKNNHKTKIEGSQLLLGEGHCPPPVLVLGGRTHQSSSLWLCSRSPAATFHVALFSAAGPSEKPSDVCSARGGGGLKGADQRAVREELCAGEGELRVEISGQQRAAVSAVGADGQQLQQHHPSAAARPQPAPPAAGPASAPAAAAVARPAPTPPQTPAAPDSASARPRPTTATQRHLRLKCICPRLANGHTKKKNNKSVVSITVSVCEI